MTPLSSRESARPLELRAVKWVRNRYSGERAQIGDVSIGGYAWRMSREEKDWVARSAFTDAPRGCDTANEARAWVEAQALAFVNRLAAPSPTVEEERGNA